MKKTSLRQLPSVDKILLSPEIKEFEGKIDKVILTQIIRDNLEKIRNQILSGKSIKIRDTDITRSLVTEIKKLLSPSMQPVINLTGTILHTNLGRALLPKETIQAMNQVSDVPINLEYDIEKGERGDRDVHLNSLLHYLTGAEAATVVNNNAAAVLLSLNTLAEGKEVIVSRGELIEIGGSFRLPEIMKKSGCKLIEVGTTNRTHAKDYENAINKNTALFLKAHTSNYRIVGFTNEVSLDELVAIGHKHKIPVMMDLGSGALVDFLKYGLPKEPTVQEIIKTKVDVITFSGDKLLGGPQAGFIIGKQRYISKIKKNPLKRALRLGKISISGLESILKFYLKPDKLTHVIPTLYWITRPLDEIDKIANEVADLFKAKYGDILQVSIQGDFSEVGSGSLPDAKLPTKVIVLIPKKGTVHELAAQFRKNNPPIIGRIHAGKFILDMRMVTDPKSIIPDFI